MKSQSRMKSVLAKLSSSSPPTGYFFALFFHSEKGGGIFFLNVGLSPNYKKLQTTRQNIS
jgi:hypothetical protein